MRLLILTLSISIISAQTEAHDLWLAGKGKNTYVFVDWSTVENYENGDRNAWITEVYFDSAFKEEVKYSKVFYQFSCHNTQIALKAYADYRADGTVVTSFENPYPQWKLTIPDSIGDFDRRFVCGIAQKSDYDQANHFGEVDALSAAENLRGSQIAAKWEPPLTDVILKKKHRISTTGSRKERKRQPSNTAAKP